MSPVALPSGYDARAIANEILRISNSQGKQLTIMQLLKLVYLAHGWWLAYKNQPLVKNRLEAWQFGPVHPDVYAAFRPASGYNVHARTEGADGLPYSLDGDLTDEQKALLETIVKSYGELHAFDLSALTHQEGTPWHLAYNAPNGARSQISNEAIRQHFLELKAKQIKVDAGE